MKFRAVSLINILAAFLICINNAQTNAQNSPFTFEEQDCPFDIPHDTEPTCGTVTLPEDHQDPDNGRTVTLMVARFPAKDGNNADPVFYLEGGPGGSPLDNIDSGYPILFAAFNQDRELVIFDQRGTGFSEPNLQCQEAIDLTYEYLDDQLSTEKSMQLGEEAVLACRDRLVEEGVNLSAYNTAQSAADVDAIRQALGYDTINLYGISYGTRLALTVMRDFPDSVRSSIIDSVVPLEGTRSSLGMEFQRSFEVFFAACLNNAACNKAYPDLETVLFDLVDELNKNPIEITITDSSGDDLQELPYLLTGDGLFGMVQQILYSQDLIAGLPKAIYDLRDEGKVFYWENVGGLQVSSADSVSIGMFYSVGCSDDVLLDTPEVVAEAEAATVGDIAQRTLEGDTISGAKGVAFCQMWGAEATDPIDNEPVISDLPTLVVSGEFDPVTPPSNGQQVAANLSNSTEITLVNAAHGVIPSNKCAESIALRFLADPAQTLDISCVAEELPLRFKTPGNLYAFEDQKSAVFNLTLPIPDTWYNGEQFGFNDFFEVLNLPNDSWLSDDGNILLLLVPQELPIALIGRRVDTLDTDNGEWSIHEGDLNGFPAISAVGEIDGQAYTFFMVIINSDVEEITSEIWPELLNGARAR
jgi:pimeloyl-ACP methyl ester carboxylesterase